MAEYIDLTPDSLKTREGAQKVTKALEAWQLLQANVANEAAAFIEQNEYLFDHADSETKDDLAELQEAIRAMHVAQDAFLRALAGKEGV